MAPINVKELDSWTRLLDREIGSLRARGNIENVDTTLAVLDTSFAELHAASEEIKAQQQQLERALVETEKVRRRHNALMEMSTDAVIETDEWGGIRAGNSAAAQLVGIRPDHFVDKPMVLYVAEEDRVLLGNAIRALAQGESVVDWDLRVHSRNGSEIPAKVSARRLDLIESEPVALLWVIRPVAGATEDQ